jgi:molybdopterin-containing oxidoreductase family iron-sulfur binding subunit
MSEAPLGKSYWRSLDELADSTEFQQWAKDEFPGISEELVAPATRRGFLKIMAASLGMAGLTACRWPKEQILPFASRPEGRVPGVPQQFATAFELGGAAIGLLVTSVDGRPIKVEGNPLHPGSLGAAHAWAQASVLELYDPDRSQHPVRRDAAQETVATWEDFLSFSAPRFVALRETKGRGLAILSEASSSPSLARLRQRLAEAFPESTWTEWEPLSREAEREGTRLAFGSPLRPVVDFSKADVIVSIGDDFLFFHPNAIRQARDFASGRRAVDGKMNRLYVAESSLSLTGAAADHRAALPPRDLPGLVAQLTAALAAHGVAALDGVAAAGGLAKGVAAFVSPAAKDLAGARGRSVVVAGASQPPGVHAAVHALNVALGNAGSIVRYVEAETRGASPSRGQGAALQDLVAVLHAGSVDTLVILGGNPVYDAPVDLDFGRALAKAGTSVHLSTYENETSRTSRWHVPRAHPLESWGDVRGWDGTVSVQQPLIEALYGGKTPVEILSVALGEPNATAYDVVRATVAGLTKAADKEAAWKRTLHDGVLDGSAFSPASAPKVDDAAVSKELAALLVPPAATGLELLFSADSSVWDGRFSNSAWLQELPDPLTRITWDNAACFAPADADAAGVKHGDVVRLAVGGRDLDVAAYLLPGVAPGTVVLPLGYGRTAAGKVGNGAGFNSYLLRSSRALWAAPGLKVSRTGRNHPLACTQDHHAIDKIGFEERGRRVVQLVREGTLPVYKAEPDFARKMGEEPASLALFTELTYKGDHQWGMAIDLSACIGCNVCSIACQAENNIPVVGKDQVARGREMHWIRVDRYFSGEPEHPETVFQPVTCQHCENAPCESVCPVAATSHNDEGINQMVYNRCVGTRYCSNNCPYKVRRFNFYENFPDVPQVQKMVYNPEVTIRSRGVMEKCTFCVQRIEAVKIAAKNERRPLLDGEIVPACAQTCPTQAIVFGDLKDPSSRVAKLHKDERSYAMLGELNVKPRNRYLARLKNPAGVAKESV